METVKPDVICFTFYILDQQNTKLLKQSCRILHWKHKPETFLSPVSRLPYWGLGNLQLIIINESFTHQMADLFSNFSFFDQTDKIQSAKPDLL